MSTDEDRAAVTIESVNDVPAGTSFEEAVAQLEECVDQLESGGVGLDEAVRLFRRGVALQAWCEARLATIRATIEELTIDGSSVPTVSGTDDS
ncbi:MAG: exodeoxyribonuclease VII small subunit [Thermoleophilia bacterium]|nr:exodeoxyribonuclease VII small subunit [Thermoleophilia bacterium]